MRTEQQILDELNFACVEMGLERMPTHQEMKDKGYSGLSTDITRKGTKYWADKANLPLKRRYSKWSDERIKVELIESMKALNIERFPSAQELKSIGKNDLHCAISKHPNKYSGWAAVMGVEMKRSETTIGNSFEEIVAETLRGKGFEVEDMTTKHPYDLLVNENVKIDVKSSGPHNHFGPRCHTFRPSKKHPTCDLYICLALDEEGDIEKTFIIPSKFAQIVTLNICKDSKYNAFINRWDYVDRYTEFYEKLVIE